MPKLYPPVVNNSSSIFYNQNGTVNITVPFLMNKAVSTNDVSNMTIKIKTLQSNSYFYSFEDFKDIDEISYNLLGDNSFLNLLIKEENIVNKFKKGQFYKIQIAYVNNNDIGYYSDVIIGKFTAFPSVSIIGLESNNINNHIYNYQGFYSNDDVTENVQSYCFNLYDENNYLQFTTGNLIHDSSNDEAINSSIDSCFINMDFGNLIYYLEYKIITVNGLELQTSKYPLQQQVLIDMDVKEPILNTIIDNDNACVTVEFKSGSNSQPIINSNFILQRSSEKDNYLRWEDCYRFSINGSNINTIWEDYTLENGIKYKYAISQYSDEEVYSKKVLTKEIELHFEDSFLYDGEKQLKIRFNPKVSSFKIKNLENKIETMGSQHPFIVKNGKVAYKEFPISGLISYLIDSDSTFYNFNDKEDFRHSTNAIPIEFKEVSLKTEKDYQKNIYYIQNKKLYNYILCDKEYDDIKNISLYEKWYGEVLNVTEDNYIKNKYYLLNKNSFFLQNQYILCNKEYEEIKNEKLYEELYSEKINLKKIDYEKNKYYIKKKNTQYILCDKEYEEIKNERIFEKVKKISSYNNITDLTSNIIYKEQQFKIKVLEWLTDGKPKLFKSPTEGNYLVRLLNVSLTPNDTLGRMLHTFNCTAYEIAECNYNNLNNLGILKVDDIKEKINCYWKSIKLKGCSLNVNILPIPEAHTLDFVDMDPGTQIEIIFKDGGSQTIQIGSTGIYQIKYDIPFTSVKLINKESNGIFTYSFQEKQVNDFISYQGNEIINTVSRQFIGENGNILNSLIESFYNNNMIKNDKLKIYKILKIKASKRNIENIYYNENGDYSFDGITPINEKYINKLYLYKIYGEEKYIDFYTGKIYTNYSPEIILNNTRINVGIGEAFEWVLQDGDTINTLQLNNGVVLEISYILENSVFKIENLPIYETYVKKKNYENAIQNFNKIFLDLDPSITPSKEERELLQNEIKNQKEIIKEKYNDYITTLQKDLINKEYIEGNLKEDK